MKGLRIFCTKNNGAPHRRKSSPDPEFDQALYDRLLTVIECFTSDAASDEQLAGELLRAPPDIPTIPENYAHLSNLLVVARYRAHAARCACNPEP
jgi:hypothetical protein